MRGASRVTELEQRAAVIDEAMTWLGTPHHNGAAVKGSGVDCGRFPLEVYAACGLIPVTDPGRYSPQFHLNRNEEWYLNLCIKLGKELPDGVLPQKGDFALYKVGRVFSHGAIVLGWPRIVHSYVGTGVIPDYGDRGWMAENKDGTKRPVKFFTLW
jgi:cell wall-associated NlpC family hydrolase